MIIFKKRTRNLESQNKQWKQATRTDTMIVEKRGTQKSCIHTEIEKWQWHWFTEIHMVGHTETLHLIRHKFTCIVEKRHTNTSILTSDIYTDLLRYTWCDIKGQ